MYAFARLLAEKNGLELATRWSNEPAKAFDGHHQQAGQPQTSEFKNIDEIEAAREKDKKNATRLDEQPIIRCSVSRRWPDRWR